MSNQKKSFLLRWTRNGLNGLFNYLVVADDLQDAKKIWEEYVSHNFKIAYHWEIAKHGGHRGTVLWEEKGVSDRAVGCYELEYEQVFTGSDHLWD